jgi:hypothetical protein
LPSTSSRGRLKPLALALELAAGASREKDLATSMVMCQHEKGTDGLCATWALVEFYRQ